MQPMVFARDVFPPSDVSDDEEKEHQQGTNANHDTEGVEIERNVRHEFAAVFDVSVTEVRHVLLQLRSEFGQAFVAGIGRFDFAVFGKHGNGSASAFHLFLCRRLALPVGTRITI